MTEKNVTLCLFHKHPLLLLGMKKRGFGAGRWNGFGGKLMPGETIEQAAIREMREETGAEIKRMEKVGRIDFEFAGNPEILVVHIFGVQELSGEPQESEEMRPQWFHADKLPFSEMWPDDVFWMPLFLGGKKFKGRFLFQGHDTILEHELEEVREI